MRSTSARAADPGEELVTRLNGRSADSADFWDFARNDKRSYGHALFPYPAMMVPQLQGALLDDLLAVDPTVERCYDPFAGSGTVLTESMRRGLSFAGGDLNPLAYLVMTVKARPLREKTLLEALECLTGAVESSKRGSFSAPEFSGQTKWFTAEALRDLSFLRAGIIEAPSPAVRRFLWVCLAGTVRLVSNSRTSTFKLHAYSAADQAARQIDVLGTFDRLARQAVAQVSEQRTDLVTRGHLLRGHYTGSIELRQGNVLDLSTTPTHLADVLMTSPPYGDNRTTVPYGQHSYLPLMWVDRRDLPSGKQVDALLGSPYRIDTASLGGRRPSDLEASLDELSRRSGRIAATAAELTGLTGNGLERFVAFCSDLDQAIAAISERLRPAAIQFWTLGDRRISGRRVPTSRIVSELAVSYGASELLTINRRFPRNAKRMAARNDSVPLMETEQVLVLQSSTADFGRKNSCHD